MAGPLFSVIVPTYDRTDYLAEAVGSLLRQTVDDFECIVVDDGSPTRPSLPQDPRIRLVVRRRSGGPGAARNTGLDLAEGRYVAFLDDDDLYEPERLDSALRGLARAPVAVCWKRYVKAPPDSVAWSRTLDGDVRDTVLDRMVPMVGQITVERTIVPRFDPEFRAGEDVEWILRLAHVAPFATIPEAKFLFRQHGAARMTADMEGRLQGKLRLLQLHADYFATHRAAAALHWLKAGKVAQQMGAHALARRCFARSLRARPGAMGLWNMIWSSRPSTTSVDHLQPSALRENTRA